MVVQAEIPFLQIPLVFSVFIKAFSNIPVDDIFLKIDVD